MRDFLIKISIGFALVLVYKLVLFILVINTLSNNDSNSFKGYQTDKARIIITGSSNIGFNYNYNRIQDTYDDFDVVGCGLNAPSGLFAVLNKLKKLKPESNDIIVFCLPYSLFESDKLIPMNNLQKQGFDQQLITDCILDFPTETLKSALVSIKLSDVRALIDRYGYSPNFDRNENSFSAYEKSDSLYQACWTKQDPDWFYINNPNFELDYFNKITDYIQSEFHSKIFFRYPVLNENLFQINEKKLAHMNTNLPFSNSFESSIFKSNLFYDQFYHLNKCGMELNTSNFISEIDNIIDAIALTKKE